MTTVNIDVPRVRGKMAEKGYTITSLSKKLGTNRNTLATYLESPEKTPYKIVARMVAALCDSVDDAASIFFASNLRNTIVLNQKINEDSQESEKITGGG